MKISKIYCSFPEFFTSKHLHVFGLENCLEKVTKTSKKGGI